MKTIIRKSPPTSWDHAPKNTLCRVEVTPIKTDIFIQRSPNENIPQWEYLHSEEDFSKK